MLFGLAQGSLDYDKLRTGKRERAARAFEDFRTANPNADVNQFNDFVARTVGNDFLLRDAFPADAVLQKLAADNEIKAQRAEEARILKSREQHLSNMESLSRLADDLIPQYNSAEEVAQAMGQQMGLANQSPAQQQDWQSQLQVVLGNKRFERVQQRMVLADSQRLTNVLKDLPDDILVGLSEESLDKLMADSGFQDVGTFGRTVLMGRGKARAQVLAKERAARAVAAQQRRDAATRAAMTYIGQQIERVGSINEISEDQLQMIRKRAVLMAGGFVDEGALDRAMPALRMMASDESERRIDVENTEYDARVIDAAAAFQAERDRVTKGSIEPLTPEQLEAIAAPYAEHYQVAKESILGDPGQALLSAHLATGQAYSLAEQKRRGEIAKDVMRELNNGRKMLASAESNTSKADPAKRRFLVRMMGYGLTTEQAAAALTHSDSLVGKDNSAVDAEVAGVVRKLKLQPEPQAVASAVQQRMTAERSSSVRPISKARYAEQMEAELTQLEQQSAKVLSQLDDQQVSDADRLIVVRGRINNLNALIEQFDAEIKAQADSMFNYDVRDHAADVQPEYLRAFGRQKLEELKAQYAQLAIALERDMAAAQVEKQRAREQRAIERIEVDAAKQSAEQAAADRQRMMRGARSPQGQAPIFRPGDLPR